jgi:hypothetical protein
MPHPNEGSGTPPWWASGTDGIDETVDPLTAHRAARDDRDAKPPPEPSRSDWEIPWEDWDARDAQPPFGAQRSAWDDAVEGFQAIARFAASRRGALGGDRDGAAAGGQRPHNDSCKACPWCMVLRTFGDARPDVVTHMEEALRHMVAAARAFTDAAEQRGGGYESIPLDDEPRL